MIRLGLTRTSFEPFCAVLIGFEHGTTAEVLQAKWPARVGLWLVRSAYTFFAVLYATLSPLLRFPPEIEEITDILSSGHVRWEFAVAPRAEMVDGYGL
jgi:hypothetical protein